LATLSVWEQQSLSFGYNTTTTSLSGQQTVNKPIANVAGLPTYTTNLSGSTTINKPTENLTGYPVFYTGFDAHSPDLFSNLNPTAIQQDLFGVDGQVRTLEPSGNITGWPTLWTHTIATPSGPQIDNMFVIPGFADAGSISYDDEGFPSWSEKKTTPILKALPEELNQTGQNLTMETVGAIPSLGYNAASSRRRRAFFSTFSGED